ncbi:MAG: hypothetical protein J6K69_07225 [Candidatus Methanomethylophilaceae archaeon]|nr:hypothetical protein [Candidatus Methanomethylophilaceae archaeon]
MNRLDFGSVLHKLSKDPTKKFRKVHWDPYVFITVREYTGLYLPIVVIYRGPSKQIVPFIPGSDTLLSFDWEEVSE